MICSYLQGGLGNTLFQIAAAIGQADKYPNDWMIPEGWAYKDYFSIPEERFIGEYSLPRFNEPEFHYTPIPKCEDCELFGYFQSERYFKHCEKKIRMYFRNQFDLVSPPKDSCAIHIRGNDYINLSEYHYNLTREYYQAAIEKAGQKELYVFTDDHAHAESIMQGYEYKIFDSGLDVFDFFQMTTFQILIMANSSFSWWAGWLNPNVNKRIIAPPKSMWFGEKKKHYNVDDLYCKNWEIV